MIEKKSELIVAKFERVLQEIQSRRPFNESDARLLHFWLDLAIKEHNHYLGDKPRGANYD